MDRTKSGRILCTGLLIITITGVVGCGNKVSAPRIPAVTGEGEEPLMMEEENILLKEAPEGTKGYRTIK